MIAQLFGLGGFVFSVLTFQQNEHKKIVFMQFMANICFTIHYYMLGAYTGSLLNIIGIIRSVVYIFKDHKWARSNLWIVFFCLLCTGACAYTWEGALSLLPAAAMICTSISFGITNPKLTRIISIPSSPMWIIYNIIKVSYGGVLTEAFNIVSIIIGMIRFDLKKEQNK